MPRKAYASVATPRLYEDLPDLGQQAVMSSIISGRPIANSLLMASVTGPASAINAMRSTTKQDSYYYGETVVTSSLNSFENEETWMNYLTDKYLPAPGEYFIIYDIRTQAIGLHGLQDYHGDYALQNNPIALPNTFSRFDYLPGGDIDIYALNFFQVEYLHLTVSNPVLTDREHYVRYNWHNADSSLKASQVDIYNEGNIISHTPIIYMDDVPHSSSSDVAGDPNFFHDMFFVECIGMATGRLPDYYGATSVSGSVVPAVMTELSDKMSGIPVYSGAPTKPAVQSALSDLIVSLSNAGPVIVCAGGPVSDLAYALENGANAANITAYCALGNTWNYTQDTAAGDSVRSYLGARLHEYGSPAYKQHIGEEILTSFFAPYLGQIDALDHVSQQWILDVNATYNTGRVGLANPYTISDCMTFIWALGYDWEDYATVKGLIKNGMDIFVISLKEYPEFLLLPDLPNGTPQLGEEVYPLVPIRFNGVDYDADGGGLPGSDSIRRALSKIKMDPADIVEAIKDNPDPQAEAAIDDVYLGLGISITETDEWAIAGLAETFAMFHEKNPASEAHFLATDIRQDVTVRVTDEGGIHNILAFNYIKTTVKAGTPGYTKAFTPGVTTRVCFAAENPLDEPNCSNTGSTNQWLFTRPIDDTTYEEIIVSGLTSLHAVYVPGFGIKAIEFEGNEDELIVPLFRPIIRKVPNRLRSDLVFGSFHLFIYAYEIQHLSWYETGLFRDILLVVAIVASIFTYGQSLTAAFATSTAAGLFLLGKIILGFVLTDIAVQWLVTEIGGTLALILAVIVAFRVAGGHKAFVNLTKGLNSTWYTLFTASTRVYQVHTTNQYNELAAEYAEFEQNYEQRLEELEATEELLDYGTSFDLLEAIEYRTLPNTTINESPQAFYDRTSTTIDLPALSNALVNDYYEAKALLPMVDSYLPSHEFNTGA